MFARYVCPELRREVRLTDFIIRWDGERVSGARSRRQRVFAACDWRQLVLAGGEPIERKARVASRQRKAFDDTAARRLAARDGRYCDLQSIRSEDTVVWSVFGVGAVQGWVPDLLEVGFGLADRPKSGWRAHFWKRLPHPDTGVVGHGPEADVILETDGGWFYAIEAKWLADLSAHQGRGRDVSQLEMRARSVRSRCRPDRGGVVVLAPTPSAYPPARFGRSVFRRYFDPSGDRYRSRPAATAVGAVAMTWEDVLGIVARRPELTAVDGYLRWRLANLSGT